MRPLTFLVAIRAASSLQGGHNLRALALRSIDPTSGRSVRRTSIPRIGATKTRTIVSSSTTSMDRDEKAKAIYGLPLGPYPIGVTTVQIDGNPKRGRGLQTEIWYPATKDSLDNPTTKYSDYLGLEQCADPRAAIDAANAGSAIGGYRSGITIEELDDPFRSTWLTNAVRNADVLDGNFPLVVFSHGSGAYRVSYSFWTEFLASHGYVVAACDHPGSARYTIVDGEVITPGGPRSDRQQMETDRPIDILQIIDGIEANTQKSKVFEAVDTSNVAITGMSFGGFTTASAMEFEDPRVSAAVMMCASMSMSGTKDLHTPARKNKSTPVMVMIGTEDTVLGEKHNDANRQYVDNHTDGDAYLLEIKRGGHVSFTSCELYDPEYGNGINASGQSKSLTQPGQLYTPMDIQTQHKIINSYGLRFLNKYLKKDGDPEGYLSQNHFDPTEVVFRFKK